MFDPDAAPEALNKQDMKTDLFNPGPIYLWFKITGKKRRVARRYLNRFKENFKNSRDATVFWAMAHKEDQSGAFSSGQVSLNTSRAKS